jgi:hypothetical protein
MVFEKVITLEPIYLSESYDQAGWLKGPIPVMGV